MFLEITSAPLSLKQVFTFSRDIFKKLTSEISEIYFILFMPIVFLQALVFSFIQNDLVFILDFIQNGGSIYSDVYVEATLSLLINQVIATVMIPTFLSVVGVVAVSKLVFDFVSNDGNEKPVPNSIISFAFSIYASAVIVGFLSLAFSSVATLFFIIPGLYLTIIWRFAMQSATIRKCKGFNALNYSSILVKKNFLICFGVLVSLFALSVVVSSLFAMVEIFLTSLFSDLVIHVLYQTVWAVVLIFSEIVVTVLFMNLEVLTFGKNIKN